MESLLVNNYKQWRHSMSLKIPIMY